VSEWLFLVVSVLLVLACAGFVASEFAFLTVDRSTVEHAAAGGDARARGVQAALRSLSTQLSGVQVGITVTNLAIGFLAEPALAGLLRTPLRAAGLHAGLVDEVALACGMVLATAATMVFGELVPKNIAIANPTRTARAVQLYARGFTRLVGPAIRVLNGSANLVVRALGVEPQEELRSGRTSEELVALARRSAQAGTLDRGTAALMEGSVAFGDRTAAEVMTPRVQVVSVAADASLSELVRLARSTGHSRFPVTADAGGGTAGTSDEVVGAVHVQRVTSVPAGRRPAVAVREVMTDVPAVPDSVRLDPLLETLRAGGSQMALVVDEYGGTAGVVTLEDVLEELVGEIADEHDRLDAAARQRSDGSWSVSGRLRPDEIRARTGIDLPEHEDYDTVAGLVLHRHGHLPSAGVTVAVPAGPEAESAAAGEGQVTLIVERMDGTRIDRVRLEVDGADASGDDEGRDR
jgi:CBS domain containing-hemolysin-like protein